MNTKEAKFLLASLQSADQSTDDPQLSEALELAQSDPDLKHWLEEQQELDQMIADKLRNVSPPADLLPSILAGTRMTQTRRKLYHPVGTVALMAALLAILIAVIAVFQLQSNPSVSDFRTAMIGEIEQLESFEYLSKDQDDIRTWLKTHSGDGKFQVPGGMREFDTAGCHLLEWQGNRASLICFKAGTGNSQQVVHLVVVNNDLFPALKEKNPGIIVTGDWATAVWRDDSRTYLLASKQNEAEVRRLIESG